MIATVVRRLMTADPIPARLALLCVVPRIAVFGGVYANTHALDAVLTDARGRGCEELFCLGDLGGFGADCDGVWPRLLEAGVRCIAGNYDVAIGRGDEDCGCGYADERDNRFAQVMYDYTLAHTGEDFAAWMRELPLQLRVELGGCDVLLLHGSPLAINDFLWESLEDDELALRLDACDGGRPDVLLCTHTGIPWLRQAGGTLVVNVGAAGRPANDGRRDVWYAVVDLDAGRARAELVPVAYDWRAQAAAMREAGLPEPFAETIETGWWTTCLEVVPPPERSRGRFHVYREAMPTGFAVGGAGWADDPEPVEDGRPVVSLFGTALFPARLWVYTNFHCNLACDYCVVASSPTARKRQLSAARFAALLDEAVDEGFQELYLTGGEPFVHPDAVDMIEAASERLPTVVLTNAMLFTGRRARELQRLAGRERLVLQSSIDGAWPETHDRWRGAGSWAKAIDGLRLAASLGLPLRVAMTQTPDNRDEVDELRELLAGLGITGSAFAVRPLVQRGFAAGEASGVEVSDGVMVPELTITADGAHWHPVGGDVGSSPDFLVAEGPVALAEAKRRIVERFLALRQADGTLPEAFHCAV
jgi:diadenosine tetraphosphatase ApaH/serine/threonine PP2A family protein phosphatase/pyruvate-formate lyase-activating enzyme